MPSLGAAIPVWAFVHGLLLRGGPPAIPGFVVPVIVNSVNCFPFWPLPHVAQEGLKASRPLRIHGDSAASVIRVFRVAWTKASAFGADIRAESSRLSTASFMTVRYAVGLVPSGAPTASCVAVSEIPDPTSNPLSAITSANPK